MDVPENRIEAVCAEDPLEIHKPESNSFVRIGVACTKMELCPLALTETKARMARLLRWLRGNAELPMTADIGLHGVRARKDGEMAEAMDAGIGADTATDPSFIEWLHQRVPADEVPELIPNLITAFVALWMGEQTFRQWVDATGHETFIDLAQPEETRTLARISTTPNGRDIRLQSAIKASNRRPSTINRFLGSCLLFGVRSVRFRERCWRRCWFVQHGSQGCSRSTVLVRSSSLYRGTSRSRARRTRQ